MNDKRWNVAVIAGTRPEVIKLAPVVRALREDDSPVGAITCLSGQHRELVEGALAGFGEHFRPDHDLREPGAAPESLTAATAALMVRIGAFLDEHIPDGVVVQGDTNTTLAAALAAFHRELPVVHVEAGLRTTRPDRPFPEEMNRRLVTRMAALHLAPTAVARDNLVAEGVPADRVIVTGNTGIDALLQHAARPDPMADDLLAASAGPTILVTLHRRENLAAVDAVVDAVTELLAARPDVSVLWVMHANVGSARAEALIAGRRGIRLLPPQPYPTFVRLLAGVDLVLTDSGGIQEEAPALGRPVLVLREGTERPEGVAAGSAILVGCDRDAIVTECRRLLEDPAAYAAAAERRDLYGDGKAGPRTAAAIAGLFHERERLAGPPRVRPARRRQIWVAGFPSSCGGADTELDHQISLWRRRDVEVHLVPMFGSDPATRERVLARGCHVHEYRHDIFRGKVVVSYCNGEFLSHLPRIMEAGRPAKVVWFNCMTWLFEAERRAHAEGWIDVFGFVSSYQRSWIEPLLNQIRPVASFAYQPFFDLSEVEWQYRPWDGSYRLGRVSRDDGAKFAADTWRIFDRVMVPAGLAKKVYILGHGPNAAARIGTPPEGLDWQTWSPGAIPASQLYRTIDTMIHKTGGSRESYCRVLIEAYAHGVVPIVERDYAFPELVVDGETGFMTSDSDEMSWHASALARDPARHRAMAENGRRHLERALVSEDACWRGWEELL